MSYALDTFLELVKIDSASKDEAAISDAVQKKLFALGITPTEDDAGEKIGGNAGNLYFYIPGTLPGSVFFSAHLDRVTGGKGIQPVIKDGCVYSGGDTILAADDIAGVAGILDGVRRVIESGLPHKGIEVLFTVAEESGLWGSKVFDYSKIKSRNGYVFDGGDDVGTVITAAPSQAFLEIEVFGKSAHAGVEPEKGINAARALAILLSRLPDGRLDFESTANFAYIQAGSGMTNIVCDHAFCKGETRSHNLEKLKNYIQNFHTEAAKVAKETGTRIETRDNLLCPPFSVSPDDSVISDLKSALADMNIPLKLASCGGCFDVNHFNAHGMYTVGLGAGMHKVHTFDEYLMIDEFSRVGELIERLVR